MKQKRTIIFVIGVFYLVYAFLFLAKFNYNPSGTISISENHIHEYDGDLPANLVVQKNSDGYDGQFYYMIALDVFSEAKYRMSYRYQRILYPALAHLLSFGNINFIPWSLLILNIFSVVCGAYILLLIINKYNADIRLSYLYAFNCGYLICILRDLSEPVMLLFILLFVYCYENKKTLLACAFLTCAVFTKEATLLLIVSLLFYLLLKRELRQLFIYSIPLFAYSIWQGFLNVAYPDLPVLESFGQLSYPMVGILQYLINLPFPRSIKDIYTYYYVLPVLCFVAIQALVILKTRKKELSLYLVIVIFYIVFIASLQAFIYEDLIDALGRLAMPLFLFSILYSMKSRLKYDYRLAILSVAMSVGYAYYRIVIFKVDYYLT